MENVTLVHNLNGKKNLPKKATKKPGQPSLGAKFLAAGTAACVADMITFPLDTAKVRLQLQGEGSGTAAAARGGVLSIASPQTSHLKYRGVLGTVCIITKEEGARALYSGIVPGLQRQMAFASIRIGMYDTIKQGYMNFFKVNNSSGGNIGLRILAGMTTGGAAVLIAQPTDVVKVRLQAQGTGGGRYNGTIHAYRTIAKKEGLKGLWGGTTPNVARNCIVNASELVSYDLIKEAILGYGLLNDNIFCHFTSGFGAGFCTTVIASPVDVVKTRIMNATAGKYNGILHCASSMYKEGGLKAFYKGFVPSFMRLGSWNIVMFVSFEQLKRVFMEYQERPAAPKLSTDIRVTGGNQKLV